MLNWEETVMSDEQILAVIRKATHRNELVQLVVTRQNKATVEAQAETTWPIAFKEGEQQGIRKVVEWVKENGTMTILGTTYSFWYSEKWQVFLKSIEGEK